MKITVVGTGYVGLVTGTCFAETGVDVTCIDLDEKKIKMLEQGKVPIYEPGIQHLLSKNMANNRLRFSTSLKDNLEGTEVVFIAVGTPPDEDGSADLKHVLNVAREIGRYMTGHLVVVTKSTVPVGTAEQVRKAIGEELAERGSDLTFDIASNPEFLKEGAAVDDFLKPDRIIVGLDSERAEQIIRRLYKPFLLNNHPIYFMDIPSAELTKYAANAMLATRISFMNEVANLCERVGADVNMVRRGIGSDPRIGQKFLYSGTGYGGSCFPKDVKAIIKTADAIGYDMKLMKAVELVNDKQKEILIDKILDHFDGNIKGRRFAIWGLSFKPQTDDIREAPALKIIEKLLSYNASIIAYDPVAMKEAERLLGNSIEYAADQYAALEGADGLILVTEWSEFRLPQLKIVYESLREKVVFDGRNIYDPEELKEMGFTYYGIGRS